MESNNYYITVDMKPNEFEMGKAQIGVKKVISLPYKQYIPLDDRLYHYIVCSKAVKTKDVRAILKTDVYSLTQYKEMMKFKNQKITQKKCISRLLSLFVLISIYVLIVCLRIAFYQI